MTLPRDWRDSPRIRDDHVPWVDLLSRLAGYDLVGKFDPVPYVMAYSLYEVFFLLRRKSAQSAYHGVGFV